MPGWLWKVVIAAVVLYALFHVDVALNVLERLGGGVWGIGARIADGIARAGKG